MTAIEKLNLLSKQRRALTDHMHFVRGPVLGDGASPPDLMLFFSGACRRNFPFRHPPAPFPSLTAQFHIISRAAEEMDFVERDAMTASRPQDGQGSSHRGRK